MIINEPAIIVVQVVHAVITTEDRIGFLLQSVYSKLHRFFFMCKNDRIYVVHTEVDIQNKDDQCDCGKKKMKVRSFVENARIFPHFSGKCAHFHLICIKCTHFQENVCISI